MKALGIVGRIMYALVFLVFGIVHFIMAQKLAVAVPFQGAAVFFVCLVGAAHILAAIAIIINVQVRLACVLLGIMLLIFVFSIHLPALVNASGGFGAIRPHLTNLLKDFALAGAAWYIASISPGCRR